MYGIKSRTGTLRSPGTIENDAATIPAPDPRPQTYRLIERLAIANHLVLVVQVED